MRGWLADENIISVTSTMAMKHMKNLWLNQLGFVQGFKMGLLAKRYFYHLIAKIQYCATLVMAEIKMFEI